MRNSVLVLVLLALVLPAYGQVQPGSTSSFKDLLSDKSCPLTMHMKDLGPEWTGLSVSGGDSGASGYLQVLSSMFGGSPGRYYTKGATVLLAGETFLVTYSVKGKPFDPSLFTRGNPPAPEKPTGESLLSLSLINLRTCGNVIDIRPFDLKEETAETASASSMLGGWVEANHAATTAVSLSNLKQLGLSLCMYAQDHDDTLPAMDNPGALKQALLSYVDKDSSNLFVNPITKTPYLPNTVLSNHKLAKIPNQSSMVAIYEDASAPDGTRGVVFLDGHAKRIHEAEWPKLKHASKIR